MQQIIRDKGKIKNKECGMRQDSCFEAKEQRKQYKSSGMKEKMSHDPSLWKAIWK